MVIVARVININTIIVIFVLLKAFVTFVFEYVTTLNTAFNQQRCSLNTYCARHWSKWAECYNPCPLETYILFEGYRIHKSRADEPSLILWNLVLTSCVWASTDQPCGSSPAGLHLQVFGICSCCCASEALWQEHPNSTRLVSLCSSYRSVSVSRQTFYSIFPWLTA